MNTLASTLNSEPTRPLHCFWWIGGCGFAWEICSGCLVLSPLFGLFHVYGMEIGAVSNLNLFGYEILSVSVDQQAKVFGYLFHIAALVAGIYSFHVRDPWQVSMALFYAASAVGVAFAGDMLSLFLWWEGLAVTSVFQIWGRKTKTAEDSGFPLSFLPCFIGVTPAVRCALLRYHGEGAVHFHSIL